MTQGSVSHGLSGNTPSNLLEVLTCSASTTIFFFLCSLLPRPFSWWKVRFVERFAVASYPGVTSGLTWGRDTKNT